MINYIHAPHKRNFAERPKKKTLQVIRDQIYLNEVISCIYGERKNETAESVGYIKDLKEAKKELRKIVGKMPFEFLGIDGKPL
jgi:hypothetical protein